LDMRTVDPGSGGCLEHRLVSLISAPCARAVRGPVDRGIANGYGVPLICLSLAEHAPAGHPSAARCYAITLYRSHRRSGRRSGHPVARRQHTPAPCRARSAWSPPGRWRLPTGRITVVMSVSVSGARGRRGTPKPGRARLDKRPGQRKAERALLQLLHTAKGRHPSAVLRHVNLICAILGYGKSTTVRPRPDGRGARGPGGRLALA